jgi:hypothetical protein
MTPMMTVLGFEKHKKFWLWTLAAVITLASVAVQRLSGPSYPVTVVLRMPDGTLFKCKLPASADATTDVQIRIVVTGAVSSGQIAWRRVNSSDPWSLSPMQRSADTLIATLPKQPPAGKLAYAISLGTTTGREIELTPEPVVIRFKGPVPADVLVPHILCMFASMLFAAITGLNAVARTGDIRRQAWVTATMLLVGGLILGPIVQRYAFGAFWTGWPFGHDLTDNKTALAMLTWLIALWRGRGNRQARSWIIAAAVVHFAVYLIPHSVLGSELEYTDP